MISFAFKSFCLNPQALWRMLFDIVVKEQMLFYTEFERMVTFFVPVSGMDVISTLVLRVAENPFLI